MYNGPLDCAWKIFKESGIRGLYRGTGATLLRGICVIGSIQVDFTFSACVTIIALFSYLQMRRLN